VQLEFDGEVWYWKGPSPFYFVTVPEAEGDEIHAVSAMVTYGWGVIPVTVEIGDTSWMTSLFPRDGGYEVPVKAAVRKAESLELGDSVHITMTIDVKY
jgi:hypothetical protein